MEIRNWHQKCGSQSVLLFKGTSSVEVLHQFPGWLHLESPEFWQALYIGLAECHDLALMSRSSQSPTVQKRHADSISSFEVIIQRQKQNANRLPIQNVKVYFPCLLITKVLENLPRLALEGAVTVDQLIGLPATTPRRSSPRWFFGQDEPPYRVCECKPVTLR